MEKTQAYSKNSVTSVIPGILAIVFAALWLYWPLTKYYFFQDDFILFNIAQSTTHWIDAFQFSNVIFWRPLAVQGYFTIARHFFGLNPFYYHLTSLVFLIINALLVWIIVAKAVKNVTIGWLTGFLFATSSTHFMSQIWIGEFPILLGMFFWLCVLAIGIRWIEHPGWGKLFLITTLYIAGLLSHELVIFFPLLLLSVIIFSKKSLREGLSNLYQQKTMLFILFVPLIGYLTLRLFIFPISTGGEYLILFGWNAIKSLWWYFLWFLNLPEELKYQSFFPLRIRDQFLLNFPLRSVWWTLQPILLVSLGWIIPFISRKTKKSQDATALKFAIAWAFFGGAPLLAALGHQYPFLLMFALPGLFLLLSYHVNAFVQRIPNRWGNVYLGIFLGIWLASSIISLQLSQLAHWTVQEADWAQHILRAAKNQFGQFPPESTVVVPLDKGKQRKASLADQLGIKIFFNDKTLTTYYGNVQEILPKECAYLTEPLLTECLGRHKIFPVKL